MMQLQTTTAQRSILSPIFNSEPTGVEAAFRGAGVDWDPAVETMYRKNGQPVETGQLITFGPGGRELRAVGPDFVPFSNTDHMRVADEFATQAGLECRSVTTFKNGRSVAVVLADRENEFQPTGSAHVMTPSLLLLNAHDGSGSLRAILAYFNLLSCLNMLPGLIRNNLGSLTRKHTAQMRRVDDMSLQIGRTVKAARVNLIAERESLNVLSSTAMSLQQFREFALTLLMESETVEDAKAKAVKLEGRSRTRLISNGKALVSCFTSGIGNHGETRLDALNAVTEYVDHHRSRSPQWRARAARNGIDMGGAWLGAGAERKRRAVALLAA